MIHVPIGQGDVEGYTDYFVNGCCIRSEHLVIVELPECQLRFDVGYLELGCALVLNTLV
jgi:hypothetical protein